MRKKIALNLAASFLLELVTLICSFILPRLIITSFGSEYNGIVNSVTQFLSFVTLLRAGIGGVTRATLYKPLVENDILAISRICKATERFMRRVARIFVAFLVLFSVLYPLAVREDFDWFFSFSLVLILGITTFAQYYFGITYQMLLQANQRLYVYSILQIVTTILNTVLSVVLINAGIEFRLMKLVSATVFASIPLFLYFYVTRRYQLIKDVEPDNTSITQRWDAFTQQVAAFIHTNTDIIVLTLVSTLKEVSVYSVYFMIINGIKRFVMISSNGLESALGQIIASGQKDKLRTSSDAYEWLINVVSVIGFVSAFILLIPFIAIYTKGISDAEYYRPVFGGLLCFAVYLACVRLPYQNLADAAGKFKETKNGAIVEAVINIVVSVILASRFGCSGVAAGTAVAMMFRTIQYGCFTSKIILERSISFLIKRFVISTLNIAIFVIPYNIFGVQSKLVNYAPGYFEWIAEAAIVTVIIGIITLLINIVFYYKTFCSILLMLKIRKKSNIGVDERVYVSKRGHAI